MQNCVCKIVILILPVFEKENAELWFVDHTHRALSPSVVYNVTLVHIYRMFQKSPRKVNSIISYITQAVRMKFSSFHRMFSEVLLNTYEIKQQAG